MNELERTHEQITSFSGYKVKAGDLLEGADGNTIEAERYDGTNWWGWRIRGCWDDAIPIKYAKSGLLRIWRPRPVPTLDTLREEGWYVNRAAEGVHIVAVRFANSAECYMIRRHVWDESPAKAIEEANEWVKTRGGWQVKE